MHSLAWWPLPSARRRACSPGLKTAANVCATVKSQKALAPPQRLIRAASSGLFGHRTTLCTCSVSLDIFCTCVSLGLHVWVQFEVYGAATWLNRAIQPEQSLVPCEVLHTESILTRLERIDHAVGILRLLLYLSCESSTCLFVSRQVYVERAYQFVVTATPPPNPFTTSLSMGA